MGGVGRYLADLVGGVRGVFVHGARATRGDELGLRSIIKFEYGYLCTMDGVTESVDCPPEFSFKNYATRQ